MKFKRNHDRKLRRYGAVVHLSIAFLFVLMFFPTSSWASNKMFNNIVNGENNVQQRNNKQNLVTGKILDEKGQAMIGVSIKVEGQKNAMAISDADGNFKIQVSKGQIIQFTYVGYEMLKYDYKGEKKLHIQMQPSESSLSDVVVIGYGKQKKNSLVSSISSIGSAELSSYSNRNITNNLAGQIPGLIAVQRSGKPGYDSSEFWIRGMSSFKGGTNPLILVDGVPRRMEDIEPDEIDQFTLLKDAAATAVYGAEGANGVILITSKRGRSMKPQLTFRAESTLATPTRLPNFMNSYDDLSAYNEALNNNGAPSVYSDEELKKYASHEDADLYPDVDWVSTLLRNHTYNMRYTLNVRGGSDKTRYFVSGAFYKENGIFKSFSNKYNNNIDLKRYNLRSNIDFDASKTTKVSVDISGQYLTTNYPGGEPNKIFYMLCQTPAFLMPTVYSDGTVAGGPRIDTDNNPYNWLVNHGYIKEWRTYIQSKVGVNQKLDFITKGLSYNVAISFDADVMYTASRTRTPTQYHATGRNSDGSLIFDKIKEGTDVLSLENSSSSTKRIYFENSINYARSFGNHNIGAMLLYMQKDTQYQGDAFPYRKQGIVGRITYGYADRYFVEGNFGYTGSENFAKKHRFGFFPAMGLAWYVSNEPYYPEALKSIVSKLKLRYSIGRTGNADTGGSRFVYRGTMNQGNSGYNLGFSNTGALGGIGSGITEGQFESPNIQWEIEMKHNYGIDLGLFNGHFDLQFDYFNNRRDKILLQRQTVSAVTGFQQTPWQNYGVVTNKGFDASLNVNYQIGEWKLSARGNYTFARNKIVEMDEVAKKYDWMNNTGTRLNSYTGYVADGLYSYDDFDITGEGLNRQYTLKEGVVKSNLSGNIRPGDIKYKDLNGDGVVDSYDSKAGLGKPSVPEVVYGFGFNAQYKGFYTGIFFQGVASCSTVFGGAAFFPFNNDVINSSLRKEVADRWSDANPSQNVMFPRLHTYTYANNEATSTWWQRNAAFLRLKNLEFGYNLNPNQLKSLGLQSLRFYVQGNNLCVWDHIKLWDPELGTSNAGFQYPLNRTWTVGVDFTF